ncbi:MAG: hypothetical protein LBM75_09270 [Myxococcales bacterium]|jgi:hypothetical protein|nr:hypothetical protein [Myxococcales bacterium]
MGAPELRIQRTLSSLGELVVKPVEKAIAREMVVSNHYSHSWNGNFGTFNAGIFRAEESDRCLGVASFGPMKNNLCRSFFSHPDPQAVCLELNRMWVDDCLGRNAESFLIGASLRLLRRAVPHCVLVQSFADGRIGHGTIYQASNFTYHGWHWTTFWRHADGRQTHAQNTNNRRQVGSFCRNGVEICMGTAKPFRVRTYRYLYRLDRRTEVLLPEQPYPKDAPGTFEAPVCIDRVKLARDIGETLARHILGKEGKTLPPPPRNSRSGVRRE